MAAVHIVTVQPPSRRIDMTLDQAVYVIIIIRVQIVGPGRRRVKGERTSESTRVNLIAEEDNRGVLDGCGVGCGFGDGAHGTAYVEVEECWRVRASVHQRVDNEVICIGVLVGSTDVLTMEGVIATSPLNCKGLDPTLAWSQVRKGVGFGRAMRAGGRCGCGLPFFGFRYCPAR